MLQKYIANTEKTVESFKELVAKDAVTSKVIEQRMQMLVHLHESLTSTKASLITKRWYINNSPRVEYIVA